MVMGRPTGCQYTRATRSFLAPLRTTRWPIPALPVMDAIVGRADVKTTTRHAHLADDPGKLAADAVTKSIHAAFANSTSAEIITITVGKIQK